MLPGGFGEAVWRVWGECPMNVGRLPGGCGDDVFRVWGG